MNTTSWLILSILILLSVILIVFLLLNKNKKQPFDYYTFFIVGIVWLILGISLKNYSLFILGLIFTITGLTNKNKWKKL